jgi:asparagine synthase (glutamine-hydrolysing)
MRGPLRPFIVAGSEATLARYPGLFDAAAVRRMRDAMLGGAEPYKPVLWRIVSLGIWGERFAVRV